MELLSKLNKIASGKKVPERSEYVTPMEMAPIDVLAEEGQGQAGVGQESSKASSKTKAVSATPSAGKATGTRAVPPQPQAPIPEPVPQKAPLEEEEEAIKELYSNFTLDPHAEQPAPQEAASPQEAQAPVSQGEPKSDWKSKLEEWLPIIAALGTEVAMGAGVGNTRGEGLKVASDYAIKEQDDITKRERDLASKIGKMKVKQQLKSAAGSDLKRRYMPQSLLDPETNQSFKGGYDTFTNQYTYADKTPITGRNVIAAGVLSPYENDRRLLERERSATRIGERFGRGSVTNPETGMPEAPKGGVYQPVFQTRGMLNPKQEKDLDVITSSYTKTDMYKKPAAAAREASKVEELFKAARSGNPASARAATVSMARMAGEVGPLSDFDIKMYEGSTAIRAQAKRIANLQKKGQPLLPEDLDALQEIARIYHAKARKELASSMAGMAEEYSQIYGGPKEAVYLKMRKMLPPPPKNSFPYPMFKEGNTIKVKNAKELKEAASEGWL